MCIINWSGVGVDHTFIMAYICVYFVCMEHIFYSGPIGMFCSIIYFLFKKALSSTSFANMGLTLEYVNPIEVLQDQWESRCYHIQTVVFTNTTH